MIYFGRKVYVFRKWTSVLLLIVFFFSGAFSFQYQQPQSQRKQFEKYFLQGDHILASIKEVDQDSTGYRKMIVEVKAVYKGDKHISVVGDLLCYLKSNEKLRVGDELLISPRISAIQNKGNPGEFDASRYWKLQGIRSSSFLTNQDFILVRQGEGFSTFWEGVRTYFKSILYQYLSPDNTRIAIALTLGDKSVLDQESRSAYANAGAMHVLAVSGMHVGILLGFLQWVFYRIPLLRRRNVYIIFTLIFVWMFALTTGMSTSVFRASLMFSILALGQLRGYSFFSLNALFVSALIILFVDPNALFHVGFQLSFLAMLGISLFFKPLQALIQSRNKLINFFWDGTALGLAAQIGTLPVSLYYFHQFPNYFILTNLGLLLIAGVALISVFILFLVSLIPYLGGLFGQLVDLIFSILEVFISFINNLPGTIGTGYTPQIWWVLTVYILLYQSIRSWHKQKAFRFKINVVLLFILGVFLVVHRELNRSSSSIVFLNDKSNAVLVKSPNHVSCIFQKERGNPDKLSRIAEPYLKMMGVNQIDYFGLATDESIQLSEGVIIKPKKSGFHVYYNEMYFKVVSSNGSEYSELIIGSEKGETSLSLNRAFLY